MISDFYLKYKMESLIRFLSLNVGMKNNLAGLDALIKEHKFDVILLQEIRLSREGLDLSFLILNTLVQLILKRRIHLRLVLPSYGNLPCLSQMS